MRLIVGLGNPDPEYQWTPHNLGFMAVDELANRNGIRVERPEGKALAGRGTIAGEEVVLAKPQTYMNLSGASVKALIGKHGIELGQLVVVYDELDLPWGALKIKPKGSAAGHNGMKSVIGELGTNEFIRVRLGIHPEHRLESGQDYLLSPMGRRQRKGLDEFTGYAADAVRSIIAEGVEKAMTKFNRRAPGLHPEEA